MSKQNQKGFGLLEVIVAILIVSVGVVGILTLASMSLRGASVSKMRLIASGLAQEGIEMVRDMRRSNMEWDNWYALVSDGDYRVQYDSTNLMSFSETPLKLDTNNGLYQYTSGDNTLFYRKITLETISADEVKVVVEVKWPVKGDWYYLTAEDKLWNWK